MKSSDQIPVMVSEVMHLIRPGIGKAVLDCTFGMGGHSKIMLAHGARVVGIDRDIKAVKTGLNLATISNKFSIYWSLFSEMKTKLPPILYDGILFDLGFSYKQIADPDMGLSFRIDGPLKMCMGRNNTNAYQFVNFASEDKITEVLIELGEEPKAREIAKNIVKSRRIAKFETTLQLADCIRKIARGYGIDPATRSFQAIRMYVNNELGEITEGLDAAVRLCKPGGILVIISFHSLEDRLVKNYLSSFKHKSKAIFPSRNEILSNARARSAKLRWARIPC